MKRVRFGAKKEEDLQQKGTIYISEQKSPKGTITRHGTIIRILLVLLCDVSLQRLPPPSTPAQSECHAECVVFFDQYRTTAC